MRDIEWAKRRVIKLTKELEHATGRRKTNIKANIKRWLKDYPPLVNYTTVKPTIPKT